MEEQRYREVETALWRKLGLEPSERKIPIAVTGTEVRVQEVGEGPSVVFLHGGPNSGTTWAELTAHMSGYRCVLVDRPGTGLSEPARYDSTSEFLTFADRFVSDLLDGLQLDRSLVVGSSLGGFIALRSAAATPERFDRMVQMACPAMAPGMATPPFMRLMMIGPVRAVLGKIPPNDKANRSIMRQIGHGKSLDRGLISQDFMDWYLALMRFTDTSHNEGKIIGMAGSLKGFRKEFEMSESVLRAVATPTHFIWGTEDRFGGEDVARRLVELMPNATLEMLPDGGHLPWLDDPARVAEATSAFLSGS